MGTKTIKNELENELSGEITAQRLASAALEHSALTDYYLGDFPERLAGAKTIGDADRRTVAAWIKSAEETAGVPLSTAEDLYFAITMVSATVAKEFAGELPRASGFERLCDAFSDRLGREQRAGWDNAASSSPTPRDGIWLPAMAKALETGRAEFSLLSEARCFLQERFEKNPLANASYRRFHIPIRKAFEARHGQILEEYWCDQVPVGAVRTSGGSSGAQIHFDGKYDEDVMGVFNRCKEINRKGRAFLPPAEYETLAGNLYGLLTDFLSAVDTAKDKAERQSGPAKALEAKPYRRRLKGLEAELEEGMRRQGQRWYIFGTAVGVLILAAIFGLLAALNLELGDWRRIFEGAIFGAAGALGSVLFRMNRGELKVDAQQGRRLVWMGALVKPLTGAVFGGIVTALFLSGLLPVHVPASDPSRFYFLGVLAFVAGLSERWGPDLLLLTAEGVAADAKESAKPGSKKQPGTATQ